MMNPSSIPAMPHQGRNVRRFREMLRLKQEALAIDLGISQQAVSLIEQKETIDAPMLEKIAGILKVPAEVIRNFDEAQANNYFNTFNDNSFSNSNGAFYANDCSFNPLDKYVEMVEANKVLYERLLQSEREKAVLMQQLIDRLSK